MFNVCARAWCAVCVCECVCVCVCVCGATQQTQRTAQVTVALEESVSDGRTQSGGSSPLSRIFGSSSRYFFFVTKQNLINNNDQKNKKQNAL